jgi:hypothetical protein
VGQALGYVGLAILLAATMAGLTWLGRRVRARGGGASEAVMGPFEDMWHPAAHRARLATDTVEERVVPMPTPDKP